MTMSVFICTRENMHPYNCGYDEDEKQGPPCRHCAGTKDDDHDPDECFLCHFGDDEWMDAHEPKEENT